jgi:hypothetical protein
VLHVRTGHAHRAGLLHHQQTTADGPAHRAREVLDRRDDDQVRRAALTLSQPSPLPLRELRRNPVRPIRPLDPRVPGLRESQRLAPASARHIPRLARLQPTRLSPPPKAPHRRRDLAQARDHHPLEIVNAPLPPLIHPPRLKPTQANQHIDRRHELTLRQRHLRRSHHPPLELAPVPALTTIQNYTHRERQDHNVRAASASPRITHRRPAMIRGESDEAPVGGGSWFCL